MASIDAAFSRFDNLLAMDSNRRQVEKYAKRLFAALDRKLQPGSGHSLAKGKTAGGGASGTTGQLKAALALFLAQERSISPPAQPLSFARRLM